MVAGFVYALAIASFFFSVPYNVPDVSLPQESSRPDPINSVIGNESFRARFGREPNAHDDEDLRIATHLDYVERLLRSRSVNHLSPQLRAERLRNLDRLHRYILRGRFPRNYDVAERRPCFIDRDGRICAVGYLVERSAGRDVAEGINRQYKYAYIGEMNTPVLAGWIAASGLTAEEAAMIQPAYDEQLNPSDFGVSLGAGIVAHTDYDPARLNDRPVALPQSGLGPVLSGGLYLDLPVRPLPKVYLHARSAVEYRAGTFESAGPALSGTDGPDTIANVPTRFSASCDYASVNADLLVGYYTGRTVRRSRWQLLAGLSVGIGGLFSDERTEYLAPADGHTAVRLLSGGSGEVPGDGQKLTVRTGEIANVSDLRFGLKGGLRFRDLFRFLPSEFRGLYASGFLFYSYTLTPLAADSRWRSHTLQLGLDVSLTGRPDLW